MSPEGTFLILALVLISTGGWLINNWIRARHGYAPTNDWGVVAKRDPDDQRTIQLLGSENERLTGQVGRLEERIAVLERIVTDPGQRTAREIDALRN